MHAHILLSAGILIGNENSTNLQNYFIYLEKNPMRYMHR